MSAANLLVIGRPLPGKEKQFSTWQAQLQSASLASPGCTSCEIWPPNENQEDSVAVLRFETPDALRLWRTSDTQRALATDAAPLIESGHLTLLAGGGAAEYTVQNAATEVIVTDLKPGKEEAYRAWSDRITKVQNTFAGFSGAYTQPPKAGERSWTTLLRFDTVDNLDAWLNSAARAQLIAETNDMVDRVLVHRVDTSFPGWFPADKSGNQPGPWKTSALVLLVLFPIVMLEVKFLSPFWRTIAINSSLATFLGNALSVIVMGWPIMPLNVKAFSWWLFADPSDRSTFLKGCFIIAAIYAFEIALLWRFLG